MPDDLLAIFYQDALAIVICCVHGDDDVSQEEEIHEDVDDHQNVPRTLLLLQREKHGERNLKNGPGHQRHVDHIPNRTVC